jgi:hypothetical protein
VNHWRSASTPESRDSFLPFYCVDASAGGSARGRQIALQRVIHNHAVRVETSPESGSCVSFTNPTARQAVLIALVV